MCLKHCWKPISETYDLGTAWNLFTARYIARNALLIAEYFVSPWYIFWQKNDMGVHTPPGLCCKNAPTAVSEATVLMFVCAVDDGCAVFRGCQCIFVASKMFDVDTCLRRWKRPEFEFH